MRQILKVLIFLLFFNPAFSADSTVIPVPKVQAASTFVLFSVTHVKFSRQMINCPYNIDDPLTKYLVHGPISCPNPTTYTAVPMLSLTEIPLSDFNLLKWGGKVFQENGSWYVTGIIYNKDNVSPPNYYCIPGFVDVTVYCIPK